MSTCLWSSHMALYFLLWRLVLGLEILAPAHRKWTNGFFYVMWEKSPNYRSVRWILHLLKRSTSWWWRNRLLLWLLDQTLVSTPPGHLHQPQKSKKKVFSSISGSTVKLAVLSLVTPFNDQYTCKEIDNALKPLPDSFFKEECIESEYSKFRQHC